VTTIETRHASTEVGSAALGHFAEMRERVAAR
jgi:hypothetical protein